MEEKNQNRQNGNEQIPELLTNSIYTPAFLKEQIGKLMRVEFLIGTNNMIERIGILQDVGANYILLHSLESDNLVYCDICSIKFINISTAGLYGRIPNNLQTGMFSDMNNQNRYY